MGRKKRTTR